MIVYYPLIVVYPLLTINSFSLDTKDNFIPYQPYTTTNMMQHHEIKVYERFWDNIIKEEYDKLKHSSF